MVDNIKIIFDGCGTANVVSVDSGKEARIVIPCNLKGTNYYAPFKVGYNIKGLGKTYTNIGWLSAGIE